MLILDTLSAGQFIRDLHAKSVDPEIGSVLRVVDTAAARQPTSSSSSSTAASSSSTSASLPIRAPAVYLSPPNMVSSVGSAFVAAAQLRGAWARLLVAVDYEPDALAAVAAFASVGRMCADVFESAGVAVGVKAPAAASIGKNLVVKNWLLTRSKKSFTHV